MVCMCLLVVECFRACPNVVTLSNVFERFQMFLNVIKCFECVLLSWQDCNHDFDDNYHICPFTDNESAKEGKASVVAECNDDRKVEDKTLKMGLIEKQFNKCTPVKGLPRKRP